MTEKEAVAGTNPVLCGSIAGRPGRFGVAMHNAAYRALGLNYTYVAFGTEDTAGAAAATRALGIRGLGITMPHKIRIMEFLDDIDETARRIGAVNTVVNDDGVLTGHNVDWIGAVRALGERTPLTGKHAAVIGAGGGARSIIHGLLSEACAVTLYNRSEDNGQALAGAMGVPFGGAPEDLTSGGPCDILAHATPVGFHDPSAMLVPAGVLRPHMVVFDAVPMPVETRLLREAKARGCATIPGVRMQLHQAACQFELYTGVAPDLTVMERALMAAMEQD